MSVTIVTAWYQLKNKFNNSQYKVWLSNFLNNINCNIVIFTDNNSKDLLYPYANKPNVKVIIKEISDFSTYKYRDKWLSNHRRNIHLNKRISWALNMLWCEKIAFVKEISEQINSDWYIWCDIGYFRGRNEDTPLNNLKKFPSVDKLVSLNTEKIYYAMVSNKMPYIKNCVCQKNSVGLPVKQPVLSVDLIAGGFFISHKNKIDTHYTLFYNQLYKYLDYSYIIKDDQTILNDVILNNSDNYELITENQNYDKWFVFQRFLS